MLNKVMLIGNITRDPEARQTNGGTCVCKIGLAVNRRYKDANGQQQDDTTFVDCDVWGKSAEFCRDYLRKGNRVLIDGRLKLDTWTDRTSGQNRSKLGVTAENVQNLTPREQAPPQQYAQQPTQAPQAPPPPPPPFPQAPGQPMGTPPVQSHMPQSGASTPGQPNYQTAPQQPPAPATVQTAPGVFDVSDESINDIPF